MRKFLGVSLAVGASVILASAAVAQLDQGSGHEMHGATGHAGKAGDETQGNEAKPGHE